MSWLKVYVDANPRCMAYATSDGDCGYQNIQTPVSSMEAEYMAVAYAISEVVRLRGDLRNSKEKFHILILTDNEVVAMQLSREYHIGSEDLRKIAVKIWNSTKNIDIKYEYIPRAENIAGKMLK